MSEILQYMIKYHCPPTGNKGDAKGYTLETIGWKGLTWKFFVVYWQL